MTDFDPTPRREPVLNIPGSVLALTLVFVAIHLVRSEVLSVDQDIAVIVWAAFIPLRYAADAATIGLPHSIGVDLWTFLTYAFLHGSWMHLIVNAIWMLAFGSAVARRFGAARFLLFSAVCAIAGAALHLAFNFGSEAPVVGASAAISGQMAAAARFVFEPGGPLGGRFNPRGGGYAAPAAPLSRVVRNSRAMTFLVIWFVLNIVFGTGLLPMPGAEGAAIAWEAHIGGFLAGLLVFPLFDPVGRRAPVEPV